MSGNYLNELSNKIGNIVVNIETDNFNFVIRTYESIIERTRFTKLTMKNMTIIIMTTFYSMEQATREQVLYRPYLNEEVSKQKFDMFLGLYSVCMRLLHKYGKTGNDLEGTIEEGQLSGKYFDLTIKDENGKIKQNKGRTYSRFRAIVLYGLMFCMKKCGMIYCPDIRKINFILNEGRNEENVSKYVYENTLMLMIVDDQIDDNDEIWNRKDGPTMDFFWYILDNLDDVQLEKAILNSMFYKRYYFFQHIIKELFDRNITRWINAMLNALSLIVYDDERFGIVRYFNGKYGIYKDYNIMLEFAIFILDSLDYRHIHTENLYKKLKNIHQEAFSRYFNNEYETLQHEVQLEIYERINALFYHVQTERPYENESFDDYDNDNPHWLFYNTRTSDVVRRPIVRETPNDDEADIDQISREEIPKNAIYVRCTNRIKPHRYLYISYKSWCVQNRTECIKCPMCKSNMEPQKYINI